MTKLSPIPTPKRVRLDRLRHRIVPVCTVVLSAALALWIWSGSFAVTTVGQVDSDTTDVHSPSAGLLSEIPEGRLPRQFDVVHAGDVLGRIQAENGKFSPVVAPVSGQVIEVRGEPGQPIKAGQTVLTLIADRGQSITAYIRAEERVQPKPGMAVDVVQHADASKKFRAVVERVGPRFEPIPAAHLRGRKTEEWGLPVIITVPADANLRPGELVYIGWLPPTTSVKVSPQARAQE